MIIETASKAAIDLQRSDLNVQWNLRFGESHFESGEQTTDLILKRNMALRYSGVHGITAKTGGRCLSVLISFDKHDIGNNRMSKKFCTNI